MTPKEKAHKLHMKYYFSLPNNGSQTGVASIPQRWKEGIQCAIIAVDAIMDFMQMDDELHDDCHFANSRWVKYWGEVKVELFKKLEEAKNDEVYRNYEDEFYKENPPFSSPYPNKLSREEFFSKLKTDAEFLKKWKN